MWPFKGRQTPAPRSDNATPGTLYFKSGPAFFEMQCKYGHTDLKEGQGIVALVLDAAKEFGTSAAVKVEPDGSQLAFVRVASSDGGFVVPAHTPSSKGERLRPDDVVIWIPHTYSDEIAEGLGDRRAGWVGIIRAKVAPELNPADPKLRVICDYM